MFAGFGGEEGFEQVLAGLGIDTVAVVAHLQTVLVALQFALKPQLGQWLGSHGVEGVADQVDQNLLQARLVDGQLLVVELAVQLQVAASDAVAQHLQAGFHRLGQRGLASVVTTPGERTQAGGDTAHAVDQVVHGAQIGTGGFQRAAFKEAHGVAGERAQRRQGLVEFVGDAGGHLPDGRQLAGLDQLVLGVAQGLLGVPAFTDLALEPFVAGAQVGGAVGDPPFQLAVGFFERLAGSQAGSDHFAPFVPGDTENRQQGEGHAHQDALHHRFAAQVLQRGEQGKVPGGIGQAPGLGQVGHFTDLARGRFAVGREGQLLDTIGEDLARQRLQFVERPPVVLQAARQALLDLRGQRAY
ncbi:hypothetical protein D3C81_1254200 [compost metagenome]